jgi:O-methyltransferase domain/Dimerisation domain
MNEAHSQRQVLNQIFGGSWITQGIYVAAELRIADLLAEGPRSAEELAEQTNTHGGALHRVLRALASVGIFAQDSYRRFTLTPVAELLRSDVADSQRSFAIMMGAEFYETWGKLLHSVRTGEQGFYKMFGMSFFQYMMENPERHGIYDTAMAGFGVAETGSMLDAYDFSRFLSVVDIGGGNGQLLTAILNRYPAIQGILFDLPAVAERARSVITDPGLSCRCQVIGGNFFSSVPSGADVYIMRHIIHDWEDDEALVILRNCREAMNSESKILVVETIIPPENEPCFGKWLDLMMLLVGGRERTEEEYRRLFSAAGLKVIRVMLP